MKKHIFGFGLMVLASAAFAELPTGDFMTWFGYESGKDANGSGTSLYGAMAGQKGSYLNYSLLLGTLSGYNAYDVNRSVGVGPWSLHGSRNVSYTEAIGASAGRSATNCQDCVFIGSGAGRETANCTNCVFIGKDAGRGVGGCSNGVFICSGSATNGFANGKSGCVDICGLIRIGCTGNDNAMELRCGSDEGPVFFVRKHRDGNVKYNEVCIPSGVNFLVGGIGFSDTSITAGSLFASYIDSPSAAIHNGVKYSVGNGTDDRSYAFRYERDGLCLYMDREKAATFEPKRTTPPRSLEIEDEDTGEKYIIKVKSGALKLYKVEETEE